MKEEDDRSIAYEAYGAMADSYASQTDTKVYNAYFERSSSI